MVFENLTLFEIQLDGSQFGPRTMSGNDTPVEGRSIDIEGDESSSRLLPMFLLAILAIGAVALYRRSQSADVDMDLDTEDVEADLATNQ